MSEPYKTTELHCMKVHIFPSEDALLAARGEGLIGDDDLTLTPDTGVSTYENMLEATQRAEAISQMLEDAVANNDFQGPSGPQGEVGPQGPPGPGTVAGTLTVTLTRAGWSEGQQTVAATGVTSDSDVIVTPAPESFADYTAANARATALGENTVSFFCDSQPGADMLVNMILLT